MFNLIFTLIEAMALIYLFGAAGVIVAVIFMAIGDKLFDWVADGQEWQKRNGYWR
jgi:predicted PurR-regulated permease PerM